MDISRFFKPGSQAMRSARNALETIREKVVGDEIHVDTDRAFPAYRDVDDSDSDFSDVERLV